MTTLPYCISVFLLTFLMQACASTAPKPEAPVTTAVVEDTAKAPDQMAQMMERIQDIETRLVAMNEKVNSKLSPEPVQKIEHKEIHSPAVISKTVPLLKSKLGNAEGEAIVQNEATDRYREAKILFDSGRFADSILEFSDFVKNFPHHAFAAAAQYQLGMAYFKQKEYKIAEEEWSRGLLSFPHSQYTPDTLLGLMNASEQLKKPEKTTHFEQRLLMLFPNSPQAKGLVSKNLTQKTITADPEKTIPQAVKGHSEPGDPTVENSEAH